MVNHLIGYVIDSLATAGLLVNFLNEKYEPGDISSPPPGRVATTHIAATAGRQHAWASGERMARAPGGSMSEGQVIAALSGPPCETLCMARCKELTDAEDDERPTRPAR